MRLKRSQAAAPESLLRNGSFRSCRHLREVLDQPMPDDEVHPPYPVASTADAVRATRISQPDLNQAAHGIRAAGATILTKE
jgi:hypothetical protein